MVSYTFQNGTCFYLCWNTTNPVHQLLQVCGYWWCEEELHLLWCVRCDVLVCCVQIHIIIQALLICNVQEEAKKQYTDVVKACTTLSMEAAVEELNFQPESLGAVPPHAVCTDIEGSGLCQWVDPVWGDPPYCTPLCVCLYM